MARGLFTAASRRYPGLVRPAGLGAGDPSPRRRAPGAGAFAGRGVNSGPDPEVDRLARRLSRRSRLGTASARTTYRDRPHRLRRHRSTGRDRGKRRQGRPRWRAPAQEDRDRSAPGAIRKTRQAQSNDARRSGDGQLGGAARTTVRSQGLPRRSRSQRIRNIATRSFGSNQDVVTTLSPAGTLADLLAKELDAADRATTR